MKVVLISLMLVIVTVLGFNATASAVNIFPECSHTSASSSAPCTGVKGVGQNELIVIMKLIINIISFIVGIASVVVLIIAGLKFAINGGDAQQVASARNTLIYALVGIVVTVLAQVIVVFVLNRIS